MSVFQPTERCPHGSTIYRLPNGDPTTTCMDCVASLNVVPAESDKACRHGRPFVPLFSTGDDRYSPVCEYCMEESEKAHKEAVESGRRRPRETFYPNVSEQKEIDVQLPPPPLKPTGDLFTSADAAHLKDRRADWDEYFMAIAVQVATRATCDRKHVGAVIVRNRTILSTGYNGSPRGLPHCDDIGHEMKDMGGRQSCVRTVHAEANAIAQAARTGTSVEASEIYTTASPCYDCLKLIVNSGIRKVICLEFYASRYGVSGEMEALAKDAGVEMIFLKKED